MSGTYVVNLFNSIEKFEAATADNILEVYEKFIQNCENIVSAKNVPKKALFGPENKKFHENLKKITTDARKKLDALKSESKNQTSKLRENLETEKNKNKSLTDEKLVIEEKLGTEEQKVRDLTEEKEKYAREKEEEQKKLKQELEQKFDTERSDLTRRAEEATKRSMTLESALRITAEKDSEKRSLDYLKNGDLHVFTAGDLASSSSRLVNEISKDDLLCLKKLEVNGFTYNLENLNFFENVERLLRDFYNEASVCLGMGYEQGKLAKKLLLIAELLNPEIPSILSDKTGWCVRHLEILRKKVESLEQYLTRLDGSNICTGTIKQNLTALRAWCFDVNSLAKKIKDFLITLDIEKNGSYDYDYYEDEYEVNGDEQDFSEYSGSNF